MQTRSKTKRLREEEEGQISENVFVNKRQPNERAIYEVNIDFDEASREWRKNKIHTGNGCFRYKRWLRSEKI